MSLLDGNRRLLLARPLGGLNDSLVQLELCRRYAAKYGRTLLVDMEKSGLRLPLDSIFVPNDDFGCDVLVWNAAYGPELDQITDVLPEPLSGRISSFETESIFSPQKPLCRDKESGCPVTFDFDRDHDQQLLVHQQAGGGLFSVCILRRLSFTADVANAIAERLIPLGGDYDAVHIRHTDYVSDYQGFLDNCRSLFAGRRLLVCSDNKEIKDYAEACLGANTEVLSVANIPDLQGRALHTSTEIDPMQAAIDQLSDLIAISRSKVFVYARIFSTYNKYYGFSGFSRLANMLRLEPSTVRGLFRHSDRELRDQFFAFGRPGPRNLSRRWIAELDQWRWNRKACIRTARDAFKMRFRSKYR